MTNIVIREIEPTEVQLIDQIKEIYEEAFRIDEKIPWKLMEFDLKQKKRRKEGVSHILGALQGNKIIGFAISVYYYGFTFPGYLALEKKFRDRGIGTQMLLKLKDIAWKDAKDHKVLPIILFEVEKPELARNETEKQQIFNRLKFYQKFNPLFLDVNYIEPPLLGETLPMYLVMLSEPEVEYIEAEKLIEFVRIIYKYEYYLPYKKREKYMNILCESIGKRKKIFGIPFDKLIG